MSRSVCSLLLLVSTLVLSACGDEGTGTAYATWEIRDQNGNLSQCESGDVVRLTVGEVSTLFACDAQEGQSDPLPTGEYMARLDWMTGAMAIKDTHTENVGFGAGGAVYIDAVFVAP